MKASRAFTPPVLTFFALYAGAHLGSGWASSLFWTRSAGPGGDPPWYFIGKDLISGLFCLGGMILTLLVAVWTRRRFGTGSWMAAWMAVLWMGYPAAQAFLILLRTTHIWDPSAAVSQWRTFDEYAADPVRYVIFALSLVAALVFGSRTRGFFEAASTDGIRQP